MVRERQNVVVLKDMYDHLASAQHFVMKWATANPPMSQDDILKELSRKDESIRTRWAVAYIGTLTSRTKSCLCPRSCG